MKLPCGSVMVLKLCASSLNQPCVFLCIVNSPSLDFHPDWESEPFLMGWSESSYGCREPHLSSIYRRAELLLPIVSSSR